MINLEVMKMLVKPMGIYNRCTFCVNGQEAIESATKVIMSKLNKVQDEFCLSQRTYVRPIEVMLLDMQMPLKNGIQVVHEMR